jgi:hypothetical protein
MKKIFEEKEFSFLKYNILYPYINYASVITHLITSKFSNNINTAIKLTFILCKEKVMS